MGRLLASLSLVAALLVLTGCAELEAGSGEAADLEAAESPPPSPELKKRIPRKWTGAHALRYRRAYRVCSVFTVKELAQQHQVRARAKAVARAQANELYRKPYRQPAFHGCLDALHGRAPGIR